MKYLKTYEGLFNPKTWFRGDKPILLYTFKYQIEDCFYGLNDLSHNTNKVNGYNYMSYSFHITDYKEKKKEIKEEIKEIKDRIKSINRNIKIKITHVPTEAERRRLQFPGDHLSLYIIIYSGNSEDIDIRDIVTKHGFTE